MWQGRWEDFDDYLNDPKMKINQGTASKLINIYEKFVLEYKVSPAKLASAGGWAIVAETLPVVTDKASADEWIDKAISARTKQDLRALIREEKTGIDPMKCKHPAEERYQLLIEGCHRCGEKWRVEAEDKQKKKDVRR